MAVRRAQMWHKHRTAYLFVAPALICIFGIVYYPLLRAITLSFYAPETYGSLKLTFAGISNYVRLFGNADFRSSVGVSLIWIFASLAGELTLGLIYALVLNKSFRGRGLIRGLVLTAWVMPDVVGAVAWRWILDDQFGPLNSILEKMGFAAAGFPWLGDPRTALMAAIFVNIWKGFGFVMIILLASLQGIRKELHEAAAIDGARSWQQFRYITLPQLKPAISVSVILRVLHFLQQFALLQVLTGGGPGQKTTTLAILTYMYGFKWGDLTSAATVGVVILALSALLIVGYLSTVGRSEVENGL
ncbi:MAG: sugar ABC transporter permease [Firmicutes bacterium]|nr:sugar ABC transporter permease [Bacillota bacterium]